MNRLLGTPPHQISEREKKRRLEALTARRQKVVAEATGEEWLDKWAKLERERNEIEEKYPDLPPETGPILVAQCFNLGSTCPTQWEGATDDGRSVYARYRWGYLSVEIGDSFYFGKQLDFGDDEQHTMEHYLKFWNGDEEKAKSSFESHELVKKMGGGTISYAGRLSYEALKAATQGWLVWPGEENNGV